MDSILLIVFLGGMRLTRRLGQQFMPWNRGKRILIYGAGDAAEMVVRDMMQSRFYECKPIGFVDDNPTKVGQRIHGLPVLGTR
ncbi:MAG: polysaccharide biosynthesis protein, partial [Nitrospiraceae bacterium]